MFCHNTTCLQSLLSGKTLVYEILGMITKQHGLCLLVTFYHCIATQVSSRLAVLRAVNILSQSVRLKRAAAPRNMSTNPAALRRWALAVEAVRRLRDSDTRLMMQNMQAQQGDFKAQE